MEYSIKNKTVDGCVKLSNWQGNILEVLIMMQGEPISTEEIVWYVAEKIRFKSN